MTGDWEGKLDKESINKKKPPNLDRELKKKINNC